MLEETDNISPFQVLINSMQSATSQALGDKTNFSVLEIDTPGSAWSTGGNVFVARFGPLISLNINKQASASLTWGTVIGSMPVAWAPNVVTYGSVAYGGNFGSGVGGTTIQVQTDGTLTLYVQNAAVTGSSWVRGTFNWWTTS